MDEISPLVSEICETLNETGNMIVDHFQSIDFSEEINNLRNSTIKFENAIEELKNTICAVLHV